MGIALLSAARLVVAVPFWIDRLAVDCWPRSWSRRLRGSWPHARRGAAAQQADRSGAVPPARPLRVLRVVDGTQPAGSAGRMVISGRIADVCAELDRLAAAEEAAARK